MASDMTTKKTVNYRQLCVIVSAIATRDDGTAPTDISDGYTMCVDFYTYAPCHPTSCSSTPQLPLSVENFVAACRKDAWNLFGMSVDARSEKI